MLDYDSFKLYSNIVHSIRTIIQQTILLFSCRLYSGPTRTEELRSTSQHYSSRVPYSPVIEIDDDSHSKFIPDSRGKSYQDDGEDSEMKRDEFRYPRNCLLSTASDFLKKCSIKLNEINKKSAQEKNFDLLDQKCFIKLNEVATSMIKLAPYDMDTMQSPGLRSYMTNVFPYTDWSQVAMKPVLINFLRRLEKMMSKIHKNQRIYVSTDWSSVATILTGLYETVWKYPHVIVNMPNFKNLMTTCQNLAIGEEPGADPAMISYSRKSSLPSKEFCDVVFLLIALQVLTMGDAFTFEHRIQLPDTFASSNIANVQQEKAEITLLNLVLPLLLLVGSGRKDVPKLRQSDQKHVLNLVLKVIKGNDSSAPSIGPHKDGVPSTLRIGFLGKLYVQVFGFNHNFNTGLKILITCYPATANAEGMAIFRAVKKYGDEKEPSVAFWKLLDYVGVKRGPLYINLLKYFRRKVAIISE